MREIKFRAWDIENKRMIYRVIVGDTSTDDPCSSIFCDNKKEFLHFDKHCGEIMQYTGLKDKHNKEIYEGDLLSVVIEGYKQAEPYIVEDMRDLYFECQREDNYYRHQIKKCEIIGNKYDNPELL
jgi:uncharacterized phage protein (TIGR01671 family)|tara:strand:+ start:853 stop:1227 length:375 start_codon:yes stop_codon:yes gene_type:complete